MTLATVSWRDRFSFIAACPSLVRPGRARLLALALWALAPTLAAAALQLPPFLLLAVGFGCGFLTVAAHHLNAGRPAVELFRLSGADAAGLAGMVGAGLLWLLALGQLFPGATLAGPWPVLGAAAEALTGQPVPGPFGGAALGYVLVLAGALCWLLTAGARRRRAAGSHPLIGLYGLAAAVCFVLHLCLEARVPQGGASLFAAAALGVGPLGLAHLLWERKAGGTLGGGRLGGDGFSGARRRGAAGR